ncbi:hypothetical protein FJZ18_03145 [Candidatus Pacearchaeota archaeon]|nr:hypothetical protein [Candidatus Pacearchaeota archaeon]
MAGRAAYGMRRYGPSDSHNQHRKSFPAHAQEVIRISDVILQILDVRFIKETRNPELEKLIKNQGKFLINVINKIDLVSHEELKNKLILEELKPYVMISSAKRLGIGKLRERIKIEVKRFKVRHAKAHVGVIGYPNTGKSTLMNILSGSGKARSSPESGFTKGVQKIRLNKDILLLDTPGVIPDKEYTSLSQEDAKKHASIGIKNAAKVKEPEIAVTELLKHNRASLESFYNIDSHGDVEIFIDILGKRKGFLKKGGIVDTDRTSRAVLKDWQEGKILHGSKS